MDKEAELVLILKKIEAMPETGYGSSLITFHAGKVVNIEKKVSIKIAK